MTKHGVTGEQIKKFMHTMDKDTVADLCVQITNELQEACNNVGKKYLELEQKFPELMAACGFAVIATCNASAIADEHVPACLVLGTAEGIQHAAQPLIKSFGEISQEAKRVKEA